MIELRSKVEDLKHYPSSKTILYSKLNLEYLTSLLKVFLEKLINNELKQISIGQAIVHAVKPKSSLLSILFGLFVELDHVFESKSQLIELNRFGFSLNYQEVSRYKESVAISEDKNDYWRSVSAGSFSQWSADNVDHNVKTIDGKGSLHGMGDIISITRGRLGTKDSPVIPRRNLASAAAVMEYL